MAQSVTVAIPEECRPDCCDAIVCPDCTVPTDALEITLAATGDLAFLDGAVITIPYIGETLGFHVWRSAWVAVGTTLVRVSFGLDQPSACAFVVGNIEIDPQEVTFPCDNIQEVNDPPTAAAFECGTGTGGPTFTLINQQVYYLGDNSGGPGDHCYPTGFVNGTAVFP